MSKKYETQHDMMTKAPVPGLVLKLGLPTTISMLVTNLYNMADTYFVGRLGTSASGATGIVFGLMAVIQACGFMIGQGSGSTIARKLGAKDNKRANEYATMGFVVSLFIGILVMTCGLIFITPFMRLLGSTDTILPYARVYARCILIAAPAMMVSCVFNNILRFEGKATFAMIGLVSGGLLNIGLDALFILKFGMGIGGAGIATAISQYVSCIILASMFVLHKCESVISLKYLHRDIKMLGEIISVGLPSMIRQGLGSISIMVLNHCCGPYGDAAIAAMSIVSRVINFLFSVGLGVGQGYQPIAGFSYGAGKYSRVKKGFLFTWIFATCLLGTCALISMGFAEPIVRAFRDDDEVVRIGVVAMRCQCISLLFIPFTVCNNMMFQSTGKSLQASILASFRSGACFIPIVLILSQVMGLFGIEISQAIADIIAALACIPFTLSYFRNLPEDIPDGMSLKEQADRLRSRR